MTRGNVFRLYGSITRDVKERPESYNTGLVGEAVIVAAYKQMPIDKLEKLRFIINKIIQNKKKVPKSEINDSDRHGDGLSDDDCGGKQRADRSEAADK